MVGCETNTFRTTGEKIMSAVVFAACRRSQVFFFFIRASRRSLCILFFLSPQPKYFCIFTFGTAGVPFWEQTTQIVPFWEQTAQNSQVVCAQNGTAVSSVRVKLCSSNDTSTYAYLELVFGHRTSCSQVVFTHASFARFCLRAVPTRGAALQGPLQGFQSPHAIVLLVVVRENLTRLPGLSPPIVNPLQKTTQKKRWKTPPRPRKPVIMERFSAEGVSGK